MQNNFEIKRMMNHLLLKIMHDNIKVCDDDSSAFKIMHYNIKQLLNEVE